MTSPAPCRFCGREILLLPCYDTRYRSFEAAEFPTAEVAEAARWLYVPRRGGATPTTLLLPITAPRVLVLHYCAEYAEARVTEAANRLHVSTDPYR